MAETGKQETRRLGWILGHVEQLSGPSQDWLLERLKADRERRLSTPVSDTQEDR